MHGAPKGWGRRARVSEEWGGLGIGSTGRGAVDEWVASVQVALWRAHHAGISSIQVSAVRSACFHPSLDRLPD